MAEINWGLLQVPDIGQAFQQGYQQKRQQNALAAYAQDPSNQQALNALAEFQPDYVVKQKQLDQKLALEQQQSQQKDHAQQVQVIGRLLGHATNEQTYQQALAAAKQFGIDTSSAPANYDPNWVQQTRMVVDAYNKDGGESLTSAAKNLVSLGYQPGTPQFQTALAQVMNAEYAKPYTDAGGATRLHTPNIVAPASGAAPAATGGVQEGATATNPQTGEKIQFRGGQWVPMQGGPTAPQSGSFRP